MIGIKSKTILFASLTAVFAMSMIQISDVQATNVNGAWTHDDVTFDCRVTSLPNASSNVNDCTDVETATDRLEHGSLTVDEDGIGSDIPLYAWANCSCTAGRASTTYNSNDEIIAAYSVMNKDLNWEDSVLDTTTDGYDWQTATAHELGHNIGLAHYSGNAYVMYSTLVLNDADRNPSSHTIDHIEDKYS